ncbi:MAG: cell division protein FtsA [Bacteroidaceae bacterium]|nr:cell division protein FtsA [Bacteroidaceae bacterium]
MDKDFVVAIELGSSRISGIAGRMKDGTMQVLAYAEENTTACVKRGVIWNIEKTYQSINSIISKLETALKTKIARVYVGVGGQSVRSYRCVIKRNMMTHSYITKEAVDSMREESYEIPYSECQVLDNYPQDFNVDQNTIADPVGVMGTNIEGEYVDIIANQKILNNINTVFSNTSVNIIDVPISACELASQVLTDVEKRSGCALVDLGADTTTIVIYKNNIVRFLVTIPLGMNNVNKDFVSSLQLQESEAEDLKIKYGDAFPQSSSEPNEGEPTNYTTSDGRQLDINLIKSLIESRVNEIVANVNNQLERSNYSDNLLAGIVLTGGGSQMKNIENLFLSVTNVEKVRIASAVNAQVVKASGITTPTFETVRGLTILSLLLAAKEPCGVDSDVPTQVAPPAPDLIEQMNIEEERLKRKQEMERQAMADAQLAISFDAVKEKIRAEIRNVEKAIEDVRKSGSDKKVREDATNISNRALNVITEDFQKNVDVLSSKEKYKQSASEGAKLADKLRQTNDELHRTIVKAKEDNKIFNRFTRWINEIINEDD